MNEHNQPAIEAYRTIGFVDTGQRFVEEPAAKLIFAKPLV